MNRRAEAMADALHPATIRADVKRSAGSHEHPAHVAALFRASCNRGSDYIPGLEALDLLRSFGPTAEPGKVEPIL